MKESIIKETRKIEKDENVRVLFLIESGSRGWGWESEDSDYDVRGVFVQDYLVVRDIREQIDRVVGELDISLWDFRKFLKLMINSNPSVWEWLSSDIVYVDSELRDILKKIFERDFSLFKLKKHYVSMARQNFEKYINRTEDEANLKKYVYVLRSVACVLWIEKHETPPPKNYSEVIGLLPKDIGIFFEKIIVDKQKSESLMGRRNKNVENYIVSFFDRDFKKDNDKFKMDELNEIFKKSLK